MYDGYKGNCRDLEDLRDLHSSMQYIADQLGIALVNPPHLFPYFDGKKPEDKGISGMGVFPGGHMTVHSFSDPTRACVFADLALARGARPTNGTSTRRSGKRPDLKNLLKGEMIEQFRTKKHDLFERGKTKPTDTAEIDHSFGPHLMMEGVLPEDQRDLDWLYDFMKRLPPSIGMTPVTTPYVTKEGGWTDGVLLIAESHIALHVDAEGRYFFDLFSCRSFDVQPVLEEIRARGLAFDPATVSLTARGKEFPR
jgi:S-adenosylmethionine/arginine decarboxylase-like enzyme